MLGRILIYILVLGAFGSILVLSHTTTNKSIPIVENTKVPQALPILTTASWGFFDPQNGDILVGQDTEEIRPIASLTKLFTAHAALASGKENDVVTILWSDVLTEGRAGKLSYGDRYTIHELLFPLLIESSNDAGVAIGRTLSSEFLKTNETLINDLGLRHTMIVDAPGLSSGDVSTVEDLAHFYSYLTKAYPHILDITSLPVYVGEKTGWVNTSPALAYPEYRNGKQGFTPEAGDTFIGAFLINGKEIGLVLLGSSNLEADLKAAIEYLRKTSGENLL